MCYTIRNRNKKWSCMKGVNIMYFTNAMFNSQYVNPNYYNQRRDLIRQYNSWQDSEVIKAAHAMSDLCNAVKKMDEQHQQEAFFACLEVMAKEFQWRAD